jgi:hypothetical protein
MKLRFFACRDSSPLYFDITDKHLSQLMQSTQTFYLIEQYATRIRQSEGVFLHLTQQQASTLSIVAKVESANVSSRGLCYVLASFAGFLKSSGGFLLGDVNVELAKPH